MIGCGYVGQVVCRAAAAHGYTRCFATTRKREALATLSALGAEPRFLTQEDDAPDAAELAGADVIITYPPAPGRDAAVAEAARDARALVYISSTAVYGATRGVVDGGTPVAPDDPVGEARLSAEARFRDVGAVVLRAPGIYGPERGVHVRLRSGRFHLTGQGENHISRIHVDDLCGLSFAALRRGEPGATHVVGDLEPTTQRAAVAFVCDQLKLPLPPSQPAAAAHRTLRGDRKVDPRAALSKLGYTLRFPSYREGFLDAIARTTNPA